GWQGFHEMKGCLNDKSDKAYRRRRWLHKAGCRKWGSSQKVRLLLRVYAKFLFRCHRYGTTGFYLLLTGNKMMPSVLREIKTRRGRLCGFQHLFGAVSLQES